MNLLPTEVWSALLGAAVGALITYRFALVLAKKQFEYMKAVSRLDGRHAAARVFVDAFAEELAALEDESTDLRMMVDDYLRDAYHGKHKKAIVSFRHFLDARERHHFDKAVLEYHSGEATENMESTGFSKREAMFIEYIGHPYEGDPRRKAAERMHAILKFALPTESAISAA
jgi:hypothetical protein